MTSTSAARRLAAQIVQAEQTFDELLADKRWPSSARSAIDGIKEMVDTEVGTWKSIREASTADGMNSLHSSLDSSDAFGAAVSAVRHALHLPDATSANQIGKSAHNLGASVTITKVSVASSILEKDDNGNLTDVRPGQGGRYVVVKATVLNDAKVSMDLTCGYPIADNLVDSKGRNFDSIEDLYKIVGNPECNAGLQPGFRSNMTWVYLVPPGTHITGWSFSDVTDPSLTSPFSTFLAFTATTP